MTVLRAGSRTRAGGRCLDMKTADRTVFELSRIDVLGFVLVSSIFVIAGVWLLSLDPAEMREGPSGLRNPVTVYFFGIAAVLFFGSIAVSAFIKLFGRKEGIVVDAEGITDNSGGLAAGFIPWSDIKRVRLRKGSLVVELVDPVRYVNRGWVLRRLANRANHHLLGSPVVLSDKALKADVSTIAAVIGEYRTKYGTR